MSDPEKCADCGGRGIEFRGSGNNTQYRVCPRWREPGHPTQEEITEKLAESRAANYPASGRFA